MEIDQLIETLNTYHASVKWLVEYQEKHFPHGCVVRVSHWRFKGFATVCQIDEVPPDKLGCRLQNGNLWFYETQTCERVDDSTEWPEWLVQQKCTADDRKWAS